MKPLPPLLACLAVLSAAAVFCPAANAEPPETATSVANESPARPALTLKVLAGVELKFPDHSVFYQRVAPPAVPVARVPVVVPVAPPLALAESVAAEARAQKKSAVLLLSATVYDRQVTELRWRSAQSRLSRVE